MKKDIENRNDVQLLIDSFYEKVKADKVIGYIFNDIAKVDWGKHLPVMYDFWGGCFIFYRHIQAQSYYTTYKPARGCRSYKGTFYEMVTTFYCNG